MKRGQQAGCHANFGREKGPGACYDVLMVVLQALLTWVTRSLGKIFQAAFGWAVVALFGPRPKRERTILSAAVAAAALWPLLALGVVFPRIMSFALAFIPVSRSVPSGALRAAWSLAALVVPAGLGLLLARDVPAASPLAWWKKIGEGFPATLGVACAFLFVTIAEPIRKLVAMSRRRISVHVPVVVSPEAYGEVSELVETILGEASLEFSRTKAPRPEEVPMRLLRWIGGPLFRRQLPGRLVAFRGPGLTILINPHGLTIEGRESIVTRVRGRLAEALTFSLALQTLDPAAQKLERRLKSLAHDGLLPGEPPARPAAREAESLERLTGELLEAEDVPWDDWQILYREMLQVSCALSRREPLLKRSLHGARAGGGTALRLAK